MLWDPAHRLYDSVQRTDVAIRPGRAKAGYVNHDDLWVNVGKSAVAPSITFRDVTGIVGQDNIGRSHQAVQSCQASSALEVQNHTSLATIVAGKVHAILTDTGQRVTGNLARGRLDLDYIRAVVCENLPTLWACYGVGKLDHAYAVKCTRI